MRIGLLYSCSKILSVYQLSFEAWIKVSKINLFGILISCLKLRLKTVFPIIFNFLEGISISVHNGEPIKEKTFEI